jgi:hypothetical protein
MTYRVVALSTLLLAAFASSARAQTAAPLDREELTRYARAYVALDAVRQAFHAKIAGIHDDLGLARARAELEAEVAQIHADHAVTGERYAEITLLVSQDAAVRAALEEIVTQLRGSTPRAGA